MSKAETFYLRWRGRTTGPYSWSDIEQRLDAHEIGLLHDLQYNNNWTTLGEFLAERGEAIRITSTYGVTGPPTAADMRADKALPPIISKRRPARAIFVTLALIAGFLGLHDFYAGHWLRGGVLLMGAFICWRLDWGIIWPWLVAIGEIITVKLDGNGRRMPWKRKK
jgi:hypothetical protein